MARIRSLLKQIGLGSLVVVLLLAPQSAISFADGEPGPTRPTGADGDTYRYNEATGLWENDHYTWDPVTKKTTPKQQQEYSYNPETGMWDTTEWRYDAPSGSYKPNTVSTPQSPTSETKPQDSTASSVTTPPDPKTENSTHTSANNDSLFSNFYDASISNNLSSVARSGDASVTRNTFAGGATTGSAAAASTIFNMLQSNASFSDLGTVTTFSSDIDGNVVGDFYLDPTYLLALQPASSTNNLNATVTVNTDTDMAINNNISLDAQSGNATVNGNTTAGNATTGDANAVVNLVNLMNSSIAAGQSFVGQLNINGDFDGDILLPPGMLDALLAYGAVHGALTDVEETNLDVNVTNSNNQTIANDIALGANSGKAEVSGNTTAGNATTGQASTNLTLLNLTGHDVVGSNSLLVFVNVLGQWIGAIVNAPAGSTSAALGGNITKHTMVNGDLSISNTNTGAITNHVLVNARSGDALVNHNTTAGNATSGNATASANIANIAHSTMGLSDWFGILFINVFGKWNGSFGVDTEAGNSPATSGAPASPETAASSQTPQVFRFVSTAVSGASTRATAASQATDAPATDEDQPQVASLATTDKGNATPLSGAQDQKGLPLAIYGLIAGAFLLAIERILAWRGKKVTQQA